MSRLVLTLLVSMFPVVINAQDASDEALERALTGIEARSRVSNPAEIRVTPSSVVLGVQPFANPITYLSTGFSNLKKEPSSWLGRNWGKTIVGGLTTWYMVNPDGFTTSFQDGWDKVTGDNEDDDKRDRARNSQDNQTALENDTNSQDLIVSGDGNRVNWDNESVGDVVIQGDGNFISVDNSVEGP